MARAVLIAQKTIEEQRKQLDEQKPKVLFADAVATSKRSILIGELAKDPQTERREDRPEPVVQAIA